MSDKVKLNLSLSLDKMSTRAGRKKLFAMLRAELDKVAPIELNEFEEMEQMIDAAWDKAELDRIKSEASKRSRLHRERDELKYEVDKRRAVEASERAERAQAAIDAEIRLTHFLESKFNKQIDKDIIEALHRAVIPNAEDWEFSRWEFVSQILGDKNVYGDQEKAEKIADRVATVIKMDC